MIADILAAAALVWAPLERCAPSVFAEKYRFLKDGTTWRPGRFTHESFEFFRSIEDAAQEAVESGRKLVFMKPAQIGGTEIMLNVLAWVQTFMPGPTLYMTSKDEVAKEFARDRLSYMCETCEPLRRKHLAGKQHGELVQMKRFTDGKIAISGGKSILNLQSQPYRNVMIDEADSLADEIAGAGDPIKLAELRTAAYALGGSTFMSAFAHPSTKDRGVGKIYYTSSDMRRAFVPCPHCSSEFWLTWDHVRILPKEGQTHGAAERDPEAYHYVTPCCGIELKDHERLAAARKAVQKSTLPPEVAKTKAWIGCHISHLYTESLRKLVVHRIEGIESPPVERVFFNKVLGDVYEHTESAVTADVWQRRVVPEGDPESWLVGQVPKGVQWLTAGQDSSKRELHWAVWGWGLVPAESGAEILRGWLVDYGVEPGPGAADATRSTLHAEDLQVFDQVLYAKTWPSAQAGGPSFLLTQCLHDAGWQPIAAYEYCRGLEGRGSPSKGLATDDRSRSPAVDWGPPPKWKVGSEEVSDPDLRPAKLNTYLLKLDFTGLAGKTFLDKERVPRSRLSLPRDVTPEFLDHLVSERLVLEDGRRHWKKLSHANHWWDCTIMAYAAALNLAPASPSSAIVPPRPAPALDTPSWWTGSRGGGPWRT